MRGKRIGAVRPSVASCCYEGDEMTKSERREKKRHKQRYGMRIRGRSIKSILLQLKQFSSRKGNRNPPKGQQ